MSKIKITGRSTHNRTQPVMHNIPPPRTELGQKILEALRPKPTPEQERVLASLDFSGLEMKLHAEYTKVLQDMPPTRKRTPEEKALQLAELYGGKKGGRHG